MSQDCQKLLHSELRFRSSGDLSTHHTEPIFSTGFRFMHLIIPWLNSLLLTLKTLLFHDLFFPSPKLGLSRAHMIMAKHVDNPWKEVSVDFVWLNFFPNCSHWSSAKYSSSLLYTRKFGGFQLRIFFYKYYPGQKSLDNNSLWGTSACSLERARACSMASMAVSILLARVVQKYLFAQDNGWTGFYMINWCMQSRQLSFEQKPVYSAKTGLF